MSGKTALVLLTAALFALTTADSLQAAEKPEIFIQLGHSHVVECLAFSPDGEYALSGSRDRTVKLWDVYRGSEVRTFRGHKDRVLSVAFSPDGRHALSVSKDGAVKLWDLETGENLKNFSMPAASRARFSPDGGHILAGGIGEDIKLWSIAPGVPARTFRKGLGDVFAFSTDGKYALLAGSEEDILIWDIAAGRKIKTLAGHSEKIICAAFSPDGRYALSGGWDKKLKLWDLETGKALWTARDHSDVIAAVAFSPDGRHALSGSWDNTMKLWDVASGEEIVTFAGHEGRVWCAAFSPDGKFILSGSGDNTLKLWGAGGGEALWTYTGYVREVADAAFSRDGRYALTGNYDSTMRLWDITAGAEIRKFTGHSKPVSSVAFSPDGKFALSGSSDETVKLWNVGNAEELKTFKGHSGDVCSVSFSPDGRYAVSGSRDETIILWDIAAGRKSAVFRSKDSGGLRSVLFSPDGKYILSVDYWNQVARLWDASTGREVKSFAGRPHYVNCIAFSPSGEYILTGSADNSVKLWRISTGAEIRTFTGHTSWVESVAFSPDGKYALSGSGDSNVKLWDVASGGVLKTFTGHIGRVNSVAFSPDGKHIFSASGGGMVMLSIDSGGDNSIRLWDIAGGKEKAQLVSFYHDEWVAFTPEGFFKASRDGAYRLLIRKGKKVFGLNQFYDVFYRPDIVEAAIRGEDASGLAAADLGEALRNPPPQVEFGQLPAESDDENVTVKYKVTSTGGGIGEIRLFHNGKLIRSDGFYREAKSAAPEKSTLLACAGRAVRDEVHRSIKVSKREGYISPIQSAAKGDVYEGSVTVEAISGINDIGLAAFNRSNTVQSQMRTASFKSAVYQGKANLYIVSIGIDKYRSAADNLRFAAADAQGFAARLRVRSGTLFKPARIKVNVLLDGEATKSNIMKTLNALASVVKPRDTFVLFIASHGVMRSGLYSIVTHDYDGRLDESSLIGTNEILEMSKKLKALTQVYILDTCHAGGLDNFISALYDARMTVLARNMGLHMFASASSSQQALDGYRGSNGLFTYALLEALDNNPQADRDKDGKVSIHELGAFARDRTVLYSIGAGHSQTPVINNFGKDLAVYVIR